MPSTQITNGSLTNILSRTAKKSARTSNGVLWAASYNAASTIRFHYSVDNGKTWALNSATVQGLSFSIFIDESDILYVVYTKKDVPEYENLYLSSFDPNAARTTYTHKATVLINAGSYTPAGSFPTTPEIILTNGPPDLVVWGDTNNNKRNIAIVYWTHNSDTNDISHFIRHVSFLVSTNTYTLRNIHSNYSLTLFSERDIPTSAITFSHTGNGVTMRASSPNLYVATSGEVFTDGWTDGISVFRYSVVPNPSNTDPITYASVLSSTPVRTSIYLLFNHLLEDYYWIDIHWNGTRPVIIGFARSAYTPTGAAYENLVILRLNENATSVEASFSNNASSMGRGLFYGGASINLQNSAAVRVFGCKDTINLDITLADYAFAGSPSFTDLIDFTNGPSTPMSVVGEERTGYIDFIFNSGTNTANHYVYFDNLQATKTFLAQHHIRKAVAQTRQAVFNAKIVVTKSFNKIWHIANPVTKTLQAIYSITVPVGGQTLAALWDSKSLVLRNSEVKWDLRSVITDSLVVNSHTRLIVDKSHESKFNASIAVAEELSIPFFIMSKSTKSFQSVYGGETLQIATDNYLKTFTFQSGAEGFTGSGGGTRNTLTGNPAAGMDVTVVPPSTATATGRCTAGGTQTFASLFGIPEHANVTSVRLISFDRRVTGATNVQNTVLRVELRSADNSTQLHSWASQTNQGVDLAHETVSGNTYTPSPSFPASDSPRISLTVQAGRAIDIPGASYTVNFDNLAFEIDYYTQTSGQLFRAIYAAGGPVNADALFVFNDNAAVSDTIVFPYSGAAVVGEEFLIDAHTRATVNKERDLRFHVTESTGQEADLPYNISDSSGNSLDARYSVQFPVGDIIDLPFNITSSVGDPLEAIYSGNSLVGREADFRHSISELTSGPMQAIYNLAAFVNQAFNSLFNITVPVASDSDIRWNITQTISDLFTAVYSGSAHIARDFVVKFRNRSHTIWFRNVEVNEQVFTQPASPNSIWTERVDAINESYSPSTPDSGSIWDEQEPGTPNFMPDEGYKSQIREEEE